MSYVAAVCGKGAEVNQVKEQLLQSNPVLEGRIFCVHWVSVTRTVDPVCRALQVPGGLGGGLGGAGREEGRFRPRPAEQMSCVLRTLGFRCLKKETVYSSKRSFPTYIHFFPFQFLFESLQFCLKIITWYLHLIWWLGKTWWGSAAWVQRSLSFGIIPVAAYFCCQKGRARETSKGRLFRGSRKA